MKVVRGDPSPEELAAVISVLFGRSAPDDRPAPPRSAWADRAALIRAPLRPGPDAWRRSAFPR